MTAPPPPTLPDAWPGDSPTDVAVVDIGSNSVRLVVYRLEGRAIWTSYNEKVLAGLGRGVAETGRLAPAGRAAALSALRRFRAVLDGSPVGRIFVAATAAVREASDGAAFAAEVERETGFLVRILSGPEEAHYAALGVRAGRPGARGVVGDLGGSSLELVRLEAPGPAAGVTLPLGPFAVRAPRGGFDMEAVRRACATELTRVAREFRTPVLHAVGGAWRSIALLHMRMCDYPLEIVHEYEMSAVEAAEAARFVARQSRASLERIPGVSKKRADTLPHAAVVLEQLIEHLELRCVSISAYGLREGLIYEAMAPAIRGRDPLIAGCQALGERQGMAQVLGEALERWLEPLWRALPLVFTPDRQAVMLSAACRLADVGARLHPDHRADLAFDQVLRAAVAGQSHPERAFLALAVFNRYAGSGGDHEAQLGRLLAEEQVRSARALGAAMRLGCDLCGRSAPLLLSAALALDEGQVVLTAARAHADLLLGEQTRKRLSALGEALGRASQVRIA